MANLYRVLAKFVFVLAFVYPLISFGIALWIADDVTRAVESIRSTGESAFAETSRVIREFSTQRLVLDFLGLLKSCSYLLAASAVLHVAAQLLARTEAEAGAVSSARADVAS